MAPKRPVMVLVCLSIVELFSGGDVVRVHGLELNESVCQCTDQFPVQDRPFVAVWNAPTAGCRVNFSININLKDFDILENPGQTWNGEMVTVFYNAQLGHYPCLTNDEGTHNINGGMPQLTNLTAHFAEAKKNIIKKIPDPNYQGLAIIDWECWRPTWARNFDSKRIYQSKSVELIQAKHPDWPMVKLIEAAKDEFERSGRVLMEGTIKLGKKLRPKGLWGFYGFPDCFSSEVSNYQCSSQNQQMNDNLGWLFSSSTALYPSIYMHGQQTWNSAFVHGRLLEAFRLASHFTKKTGHSIPVFPYFRHVYVAEDPYLFKFLSNADLHNTIGQAANMGAAGLVMWGNRRDENTSPEVCRNLDKYIHDTLGPYLKSVKRQVEACSENKCNGRGRCVNKEVAVTQGLLSRLTCTGPHQSFTKGKDTGTSDNQILQAILQLQRRPVSDQSNETLHGVKMSSGYLKVSGRNNSLTIKTPSGKHKAKNLTFTKNAGKPPVNHIKDKVETSSMPGSGDHTLTTGTEGEGAANITDSNGTDVLQSGVMDTANITDSNGTDVLQSGVRATGGLRYHDVYQDGLPTPPKPGQPFNKGPNGIVFCKDSDSGSPQCILTKRQPLAKASHGARIPQAYMFVIGASLGSALLLSTVYIVTYYYFNIRKKTTLDKSEPETDPILESVEAESTKENKFRESLDHTDD